MVLSDLGKRINQAIKKLSNATIIDEEVTIALFIYIRKTKLKII